MAKSLVTHTLADLSWIAVQETGDEKILIQASEAHGEPAVHIELSWMDALHLARDILRVALADGKL